jgi:sugar phosphate isomerase/epimerase
MLAEAGGRDLVINADPKGGFASPLKKTEDEFKQQGENLSVIAEICKPYGLKASLHNHADDSHNAEGDLRSVISYASADTGLCVDTGWAMAAGIQPEDWLTSYPERIFSLHLRNQRGSVPAEDLLEGELDIEAFVKTLYGIGYTGWLTLELWHREDTFPIRSLKGDTKLSAGFLKRITADMV